MKVIYIILSKIKSTEEFDFNSIPSSIRVFNSIPTAVRVFNSIPTAVRVFNSIF